MPYLKLVTAVVVSLFLVACKIQISVPERGGSVASDNIACSAGEQCDLVVETADFNEVFVARPDPGYEFVGWRKAPAYFCGGTDQACTVSTLALASNPSLLSLLTLDLDFFLEPIFACQTDGSGTPAAECGVSGRTLTGQAQDIAAAGATVTVTVNGQAFTTTANDEDVFSVAVDAADDDLISVVLEGAAGQLAAVAGTVAEVEAGGITLSPVTTARYGLSLQANNGAVPVNSQQLYATETSTDPDTLLELAAAISLILNDPGYSVPSGSEDLLDFVADSVATSNFIAGVNESAPSLIDATVAQLTTDTFAPADVAARYIAVAPSIPGYLSRFGGLVDLSGPGQTGSVSGAESFPLDLFRREFSWQVSGGELVLSYLGATTTGVFFSAADTTATPEQLALLEAEEAQSFLFYNYTDSLLDDRYTLIDDGTFVEFTSRQQRSSRSFDPVFLSGGTVQLPDGVVSTGTTESLRPEAALPPIPFEAECSAAATAPCVVGTWGGLYLSSPANDSTGSPLSLGSYADVVTFSSNGTAVGEISGRVASWTVQDGKLMIDFSDGWTQTVTLIQQEGVEYGAFVEFFNGGENYGVYDVYVKRDESLVIDASTVTNPQTSYWANDLVAFQPGVTFTASGQRDPASTFGFSFYSIDGEQVGFTEFTRFTEGEPSASRNPLTWVLEPDRIVFNRAPGRDRARYFYPLAADTSDEGRRLFGVEYEISNEFTPQELRIPPRTTIYAEVPLPATE